MLSEWKSTPPSTLLTVASTYFCSSVRRSLFSRRKNTSGSLSQARPLSWRRKIVLPMDWRVETRSRWASFMWGLSSQSSVTSPPMRQ